MGTLAIGSQLMTSNQQQAVKGCPENCNLSHALSVFARLYGISRASVYKLKKKGLPVKETVLGPRVNCREARAFIEKHQDR